MSFFANVCNCHASMWLNALNLLLEKQSQRSRRHHYILFYDIWHVKYLIYLTCFHCVFWICLPLTTLWCISYPSQASSSDSQFLWGGVWQEGRRKCQISCSFSFILSVNFPNTWLLFIVRTYCGDLQTYFHVLFWGRFTTKWGNGIGAVCVYGSVLGLGLVMSDRMFLSNALLPLRQVSFCRDSLSPPWGDSQRADSSRTCGDSGFISPGCLALSSYPLRVGRTVPRTQGAAGRETLGWTEGGWWRTGTEC